MLAFANVGGDGDRTVRRVLGRYWVQGDDVAAQEQQIGAIGGIVVMELAFSQGAASIPGPLTERQDDTWSLWEPFMQTNELVVGGGIGLNSSGPWNFDSKAMRKLPDGTIYVLMVENGHATFGMSVLMTASLLVSH